MGQVDTRIRNRNGDPGAIQSRHSEARVDEISPDDASGEVVSGLTFGVERFQKDDARVIPDDVQARVADPGDVKPVSVLSGYRGNP